MALYTGQPIPIGDIISLYKYFMHDQPSGHCLNMISASNWEFWNNFVRLRVRVGGKAYADAMQIRINDIRGPAITTRGGFY